MPIKCRSGQKVRYRWRTTKSGKRQRLAFCGNKVVEVKNEGGKAKKVSEKGKKGR